MSENEKFLKEMESVALVSTNMWRRKSNLIADAGKAPVDPTSVYIPYAQVSSDQGFNSPPTSEVRDVRGCRKKVQN